MAKTIVFANQKGGVGKTSLVLQTSHILSDMGFKVLLVDFDPQGNASTRIYQGEYTGTAVHELFQEHLDIVRPVECKANLWGILSPPSEADGEQDSNMVAIQKLDESMLFYPKVHLDTIEDQFDFLLFDTPPNLGNHLVAACVAATYVVVPVLPAGFASAGIMQLYNTLLEVQNSANPDLEVLGFVLNNVDASTSLHKTITDGLREQSGSPVFNAQIGRRSRIDLANYESVPVSNFKDGAGRRTHKELVAVVNELLERIGDSNG